MFPDFKKANTLGMFLHGNFAMNSGVAVPFQQVDCSFSYPCPHFSVLHVTFIITQIEFFFLHLT